MSELTYMEVESIRHLLTDCQTKAKKLGAYVSECQSKDLRDICEREIDSSLKAVQTLTSFLNEGGNLQ